MTEHFRYRNQESCGRRHALRCRRIPRQHRACRAITRWNIAVCQHSNNSVRRRVVEQAGVVAGKFLRMADPTINATDRRTIATSRWETTQPLDLSLITQQPFTGAEGTTVVNKVRHRRDQLPRGPGKCWPQFVASDASVAPAAVPCIVYPTACGSGNSVDTGIAVCVSPSGSKMRSAKS